MRLSVQSKTLGIAVITGHTVTGDRVICVCAPQAALMAGEKPLISKSIYI